jgi:alcohol dehydrogenase class IV
MIMNKIPAIRKFVTPEILYGRGAIYYVGQYARNFGAAKILIVTDEGVIEAGWVKPVMRSLSGAGIPFVVFSGVTPNPKEEEVTAGAELFRQEECNLIVAVGGGSPIDCAKGIGIVRSNGRNILDFEGIDRIEVPAPPLICVPTTGSGADVSQFTMINDRRRKKKIAVISKALVPDVSLTDPSTNVTMPADLTVQSGFEALVHGIESYVSTVSSSLTDMMALKAIGLVAENLVPALKVPGNADLRERMATGSMYAGLAFSNAGLGAVHAMAHGIGGLYDFPHGETDAILLDHVVKFNYKAVPGRFEDIARAMGLDLAGMGRSEKKDALIEGIVAFKKAAGVPLTLRQYGVEPGDIPALTERAIKDICMATNPVPMTEKDVEAIYEEAM